MSTPAPTLIISNIAWDFVWQRHQTVASLFAAAGCPVIFCELPGTRRVGLRDAARILRWLAAMRRPPAAPLPVGLQLLRPFVLPATNALSFAFNARQVRRLTARAPALATGVPLVVNYSASRTARQLIATVPHQRLVYDCTDDWLAVQGIPAHLAEDERWLLERADLTLVPSRVLQERKAPLARRCVRLAHGAFVERFVCAPRPVPSVDRLTLLYYGHLHRQHLDFALLEGIARARPDWRIVLVGPVVTTHRWPANVELPGQQAHENLRSFIAQADVLLLPYALNDYTRAVMPAKTYECLATGRPILAAPLPELVADFAAHLQFPVGVEAWIAAAIAAVTHDTSGQREARVALAQANSWNARFAQLQSLLAGLPM